MVGADFIDTKSPTLEEMLKLTKPTVVTLLFLPQFPAEFPSVKTIREEASRLKVDVKHFTLDTPEKCKGVINKLAAYASESCWVVIEYCHLMSNYPDILDSMNEVSANSFVGLTYQYVCSSAPAHPLPVDLLHILKFRINSCNYITINYSARLFPLCIILM